MFVNFTPSLKSMATELFNLKQVDHETDCLISGFIREMQQSLPENNTFYIIPELINYECLRFYHIPERFIKCSKDLSMNEKENCVKQSDIGVRDKSAHGVVKISCSSNFIHIWKFKIINHPWFTYIGITSATEIDVETRFTLDTDNEYYAFSNGGYKYDLLHAIDDGYNDEYDAEQGDWCEGFAHDDFVIMELNPIKKTLQYYVIPEQGSKSKELRCIFKDIVFEDQIYRMAVCMGFPNAILELVEYIQKVPEL